MQYIFEDSEDSILSIFYRKAFKYNENKIHYTNGNSKILNYILQNDITDAIVFLDFPTDNKSVFLLYNRLVTKIKGRNIVVIPIVNSEYYFVKSLPLHLYKSDFIDLWKYNNPSVKYEHYCKKFIQSSLICTLVDYTEFDCLCIDSISECETATVQQKAIKYVEYFPCFPSTNSKASKQILNNSKIIQLGNKLITGYQKYADKYDIALKLQ